MHHGQSRGKRNTDKVCKKQVNFSKTGEKIFKVGRNNNFCETGGKCTETGKIGRIRNLKKGHQRFCQMTMEKFVGKREIFHSV